MGLKDEIGSRLVLEYGRDYNIVDCENGYQAKISVKSGTCIIALESRQSVCSRTEDWGHEYGRRRAHIEEGERHERRRNIAKYILALEVDLLITSK